MALTAKQEKFCEEYMIDLNATQAAIRAGYSEKTADVIGCENLGKPSISERITELKESMCAKTRLTADFIINGLMEEAQYCSEGSSHGARVKAFEVLGKYKDLNLWKESVEHSVDQSMADRIMRARNRGSDSK
ncbi:MAG: terminase small subunit [Nitrosomonadaceae bacterium]